MNDTDYSDNQYIMFDSCLEWVLNYFKDDAVVLTVADCVEMWYTDYARDYKYCLPLSNLRQLLLENDSIQNLIYLKDGLSPYQLDNWYLDESIAVNPAL